MLKKWARLRQEEFLDRHERISRMQHGNLSAPKRPSKETVQKRRELDAKANAWKLKWELSALEDSF